MKLQKKLLVFVMVLVLSLSAFAIGASAETSAPITYEGLSARTTQDFAGLRAIYKVDESKFGEGAVIYGVLAASATKVDSIEALTVAKDSEGIVTNAANTQMVVVRDDTNKNAPTNTYTNAEKTEFAYTIAYFYESQTPDILKNDFFFRAFYIVGNGAPVYVGMSGDNFGKASSLFDVATVLSTKDDFKDLQSVKNVLTRASSLKTSATFKPADATEGKIILDNMAPGIYQVAVKGKTPENLEAHASFGFKVQGTKQGFSARINKSVVTFDTGNSYVNAFACVLEEGENIIELSATSTLKIEEYQLSLVQALPLATEQTYIDVNAYMAVKGYEAVANVNSYVRVPCEKGETHTAAGVCSGYHYYKATHEDSYQWTYNENGVAGTDYFVSLEQLPDNCFVRNIDAATENTGTYDYGGSADYGHNYSSKLIAGNIFLRASSTVKLTITAPKAGTYKIYTACGTNGTVTLAANANEASALKFSMTSAVGANVDANASGANGIYYGNCGSVALQQGANVLVFEVTGGNFMFSGFNLVFDDGSHTVDFVYADALGAQHILSRQIVADGADADVPTFFPSACYSIADASAAKTVTKDTTIVVDVAHEGEAVLVAPSFGTAGSYTMPDCTKCGEKGVSYTLAQRTASATPLSGTVDITAKTVTINDVVNAGFYRITFGGTLKKAYVSVTDSTYGIVSMNRVPAGTSTEYPVYAYLTVGKNILTLNDKGADITNETPVTAVQVTSEKVVQVVKNPSGSVSNGLVRVDNGDTSTYTITVEKAGFYQMQGMTQLAGSDFSANITIKGGSIDTTLENVSFNNSLFFKKTDKCDGSSGSCILSEYGFFHLQEGVQYTITVTGTAGGGSSYINLGALFLAEVPATEN